MDTAATALPRWACDILSAAPQRGEGLHRWLLRAAIALRRCGRVDQEIIDTLRAATIGEPVRAGEIEDAVTRSIDCMTDNGVGARPAATSKWPSLDTTLRSQIVATTNITVADLWEASPVHFDDDTPHTDEILATLFPGNPLLCVAVALENAITRPLSQLKMSPLQQFVVPSPMTAPTGTTKSGRVSARCLDNTGLRKYLVIEQDSGEPDDQASIISHLTDFAPLVLVVHSGGKSLHAWFACRGQPESTVFRFFDHAVRVGADPATWTRCQLVRMPDGTRRIRGGGFARQSVLFWNRDAAQCA